LNKQQTGQNFNN